MHRDERGNGDLRCGCDGPLRTLQQWARSEQLCNSQCNGMIIGYRLGIAAGIRGLANRFGSPNMSRFQIEPFLFDESDPHC